MLWHGVSANKKAGKSARSVLLHPVQRCYKFPIPLHPSSSNLIPFISQTPYIYLTGFQEQVIEPCPYLIECVYSDNGSEYKGGANHAFGVTCWENGINQKFTRPARPQTNGKAERVIRTLMEMRHEKQSFDSPEHRQKELCLFVNFYNTVKPHGSLDGNTPFEVLQAYFSQPVV